MEAFLKFLAVVTNDVFASLILLLLGVATLVSVLEWIGVMPRFISRYLARNRSSDIKEILIEMGVNFKEERRIRMFSSLTAYFESKKDVVDNAKDIINRFLKKGSFTVGRTNQLQVKEFADLMSGSCDPNVAKAIARCLSTYLRLNLVQGRELNGFDIDFVATPKNGSPFIGYEFSQLIKKPLVLHDCNETKYHSEDEDLSNLSKFDSSFEILPGMVGLIVDDSTTGGRKVKSLADDLRKLGCVVSDCLVVFEPQGKQAKSLLSSSGIRLHSIVER